MARRGRGAGSARTKTTPGGRPSAVNGSANGMLEPGDEPGARTIGALALKRFVARGAGRGEADDDGGAGPVTHGPFDEEDLDPEHAAAERVDFGAVQVPVPRGGEVSVEPEDGRLQAVHVMLPAGRLSVSALAAPRTEGLWPDLAAEIDESLREGGATVRSFTGEWGRELHARTGDASSLFVGVDGPRWMLYGVATGPTGSARELDAALRVMLRGTVVVRGRSPYPVRTVLPLTVPEHLSRPGPIAMPDRVPVPRASAEHAPAPPPRPPGPPGGRTHDDHRAAGRPGHRAARDPPPDPRARGGRGTPRRGPSDPRSRHQRSRHRGGPGSGGVARRAGAGGPDRGDPDRGDSDRDDPDRGDPDRLARPLPTPARTTRAACRAATAAARLRAGRRSGARPRRRGAAGAPGPARTGRPGPTADDPGLGAPRPEPGETPPGVVRGAPAPVPHEHRPPNGSGVDGSRSNGFVPRELTHDGFGMPHAAEGGDAPRTGYAPYGTNGSANGSSYWANGAGYGPPEEPAAHDVPQADGTYVNGGHVNGTYANGTYVNGRGTPTVGMPTTCVRRRCVRRSGVSGRRLAARLAQPRRRRVRAVALVRRRAVHRRGLDRGRPVAGVVRPGRALQSGRALRSGPAVRPGPGSSRRLRARPRPLDRGHRLGVRRRLRGGSGAEVPDAGADDWTLPLPVVRAAPVPEPEPVRPEPAQPARPEPVRPAHGAPDPAAAPPRSRRARRAAEERAVGSQGRMPQPGTPQRWRSERRPDERSRSEWADSGWEAAGMAARGEPDRGAHATDRSRHGGHRAVEPGDDPTDRAARRHASAHGRHSDERDDPADRPRHRRPEH